MSEIDSQKPVASVAELADRLNDWHLQLAIVVDLASHVLTQASENVDEAWLSAGAGGCRDVLEALVEAGDDIVALSTQLASGGRHDAQ